MHQLSPGCRMYLLNTSRQVGVEQNDAAALFQTFLWHQISSRTLRVFIAAPHNAVKAVTLQSFWDKRAITGLMSVTKEDFDCQPLFCLLVGEGAISIALTVHQSFWNWILVRRGFHKTHSDTAISFIQFKVKAEARLSALWHILTLLDYGDRKIVYRVYPFKISQEILRQKRNPPQCSSRRKLQGAGAEQQLHLVVTCVPSGQCVEYQSL